LILKGFLAVCAIASLNEKSASGLRRLIGENTFETLFFGVLKLETFAGVDAVTAVDATAENPFEDLIGVCEKLKLLAICLELQFYI
jgi:hypothetical protein